MKNHDDHELLNEAIITYKDSDTKLCNWLMELAAYRNDPEDLPQMYLLLRYVPEEKRPEFIKYVTSLVNNAEIDVDWDLLGFMDDYVNFASLLKRKAEIAVIGSFWDKTPRTLTVYDVGCFTALQHVFFDSRIKYVGINRYMRPEPVFFRDNCSFVQGRFCDVVKDLKIDYNNSIGIANMSLLYGNGNNSDELDLFDRTFKRKFIL